MLLLNDDYTTMDFVVQVLEKVFLKSPAEAFRIMMHVHTQGKGLCGLYPHDIAETKVATVHDMAQEHGFPLRAEMEQVAPAEPTACALRWVPCRPTHSAG